MTRVRFAPSPTGMLHVGGARTALFNWLFARHTQGKFVLRIEDTDAERSRIEYEGSMLEDLQWLGLDWDEGPDKEGEYAPYRQSERLDLYRSYVAKLQEQGVLYPCYCTQEDLAQERKLTLERGHSPKYSGRCRKLTDTEKAKYEREGRRGALRFAVGRSSKPVVFEDIVRGAISWDRELLGDFVIVREDGIPTYNFAVVIDDSLMGITHVIRGEEHIANTPRQVLLYEALGFTPPQFAHASIILAPDRSKLSKRHGEVSIGDYRRQGFLAEAIFNFLSLLGWSPGDNREIMTRQEIFEAFDLKKLSKSAAIFDVEKLKWMNGEYIRKTPLDCLFGLVRPFLVHADLPVESVDAAWLTNVIGAVKDDVTTLADFPAQVKPFFEEQCVLDEEARSVLSSPDGKKLVDALKEVLNALDRPLSAESFETLKKTLAEKTGLKGKNLFIPMRASLTGKLSGHELPVVVSLLGRDRCLRRLSAVIQQMGW